MIRECGEGGGGLRGGGRGGFVTDKSRPSASGLRVAGGGKEDDDEQKEAGDSREEATGIKKRRERVKVWSEGGELELTGRKGDKKNNDVFEESNR